MGDAFTDRLYHTGGLHPDAAGEGHGIEPGAKVGVGEVEPDGDVPDPDLARTWTANGNLLPAQDRRVAGLVKPDSMFHETPPIACRR